MARDKIPPLHRKQIKALDTAIRVMLDWRRRHYSSGEAAYQKGIRGMTFADDGHRHYESITQDIQQLEDLKEIILEPPAVVSDEPGPGAQMELFIEE